MNKETLEEAAERFANECNSYDAHLIANGVEFGAKWQQEQDKNKFSEEEVLRILLLSARKTFPSSGSVEDWFEQFKKK